MRIIGERKGRSGPSPGVPDLANIPPVPLRQRRASRASSSSVSPSVAAGARRRAKRMAATPARKVRGAASQRRAVSSWNGGFQQNEVAVAGDEIGPDRGVRLALGDPSADQEADVAGQRGVGVVHRLVLAHHAAQIRRRAPGRAPRAPEPSSPRPAAPRALGVASAARTKKTRRTSLRAPRIRPFGPPSPAGGRRDEPWSAPLGPRSGERVAAEGRRVRGSGRG